MSTVKSRISQFIKAMGITVVQFEKSIRVSNGYVSSISKSIQPDKLEIISKLYPELNIEWLLIGNGEMLKQGSASLLHIGSNNKIGNKETTISGSNVNYNDGINEPATQYEKQKEDNEFKAENERLRMENEYLKKEIELVEKAIEEKERLIQVLMNMKK